MKAIVEMAPMKSLAQALVAPVLFVVVMVGIAIAQEVAPPVIKSSSDIEKILTVKKRGFDVKPNIVLDVRFEYDSSDLTEGGQRQLVELAAALKNPNLCTKIYKLVGHTDSVGSEEYNQILSEARAVSALEYLVQSLSIDSKRLLPVGAGKRQPLNTADTTAPENRRVEIQEHGELESCTG